MYIVDYVYSIYISHTACKMSFDKIFDLTAGVYFNFYNIHSRRAAGWNVMVLLFHINSCQKSTVRGHTTGLIDAAHAGCNSRCHSGSGGPRQALLHL